VDVSVIIVNWNTKQLLRDCISSVYEHSDDIDYEIIVIDNASTDGSTEMVKADFPQVVLIENPDNRGFATANNQGIAIAKGRYVLLLNSDTVVLNDAIANTVRFADENPKTAVIGCRVLNPDKTLQRTCFMYPSVFNMLLSSTYLYKLFPKNRFFGREQMTWWDRDDIRRVDVVTGCYMLVRQDAIEQVGMMDENFFMYGEETDWCYRFQKSGWEVMFAPVGEIIHFGGQSTAQRPVAMIVQLRMSILKFMRKHYNRPAYFTARLMVALFFAFRLPVWMAKGLISPAVRNEAAIKLKAYSTGVMSALLGRINSEKI
jgi:GT2 family glycosyltransferase